MSRRLLAALALALASAAGCGTLSGLPTFGTDVPTEQVIARIQANRGVVRTVDGAARVRTETPGKSGSFDADLVIERPHRFRQIGYAYGTILFDLLLEGRSLTVYNPGDNVVFRHELGSTDRTPESLTAVERFFARTPIAQLLLGPGRFEAAGEEWRELARDDALITLGCFRGSRQVGTILVDNDVLLMREHRIAPEAPGGPDLTVRFADWREVPTAQGPVWWPFEIQVESVAEQFYMGFWFDQVTINGPLTDEMFDQLIPADAEQR